MTVSAKPFVVLLAEDEPADAHLVRVIIAENHILADLHTVSDGREALEFLRRQGGFAGAPRPNLILLDLNMPRMDGREFLFALKQDKGLRDIPAVVLSTSNVERDIVASYRLGAVGYITKPTNINQFRDAIRQLCEYWFALVRLPSTHD